ncbi:hypothetical protein [Streptomyces sp. V2]|uniref:hypothetical protein n=1 Tax=Streptomyces sp. V2 TaxID=1424099 RepID=UPI0019D217E1|nr:hypothetical protein [Streptomyces sp. V2]
MIDADRLWRSLTDLGVEHGVPVGIVTGVQGISWQETTLHGRAAHAGTTPTRLRADAGLAAAQVVVTRRELGDFGEYGALRATVGHHLSLLSGAGRDAQEIAALCPMAMNFVRGECDGISPNPREYSTPEACGQGVDVLATPLLRRA